MTTIPRPEVICIPPASKVNFDAVAELMRTEAEAGRYAGVAMVALGDDLLLEQSVGHMLRWAKLPITLDTRFQLASMSKLFTTISVGQLVEQGTLKLDDAITKWLPEFADRNLWSKVSISHLLAHTSGFGTYWGPKFEQLRTTLRSVQDHFQLFESDSPSFEPNSKFEYSNIGYILLGAIIERASEQDYFSYVQTHVFDRAKMHDSGFFEADEDTPNMATGYTFWTFPDGVRGNVAARVHTHLKPIKGSPAGDAVSTGPDLIRFGQALLAGKLLKPATLDELWQPLHSMSRSGSDVTYRMARGFMTIDSDFGNPIGHTGGFPGTTASFFVDPKSSLVAVTLASVDPEDAEPINVAFTNAWLRHDFRKLENAAYAT